MWGEMCMRGFQEGHGRISLYIFMFCGSRAFGGVVCRDGRLGGGGLRAAIGERVPEVDEINQPQPICYPAQ